MNEGKFKISMSHSVRVTDDDGNVLGVNWEYCTGVSLDQGDTKKKLLLKALEHLVNTEKLKLDLP